jgi:hypothetical protein
VRVCAAVSVGYFCRSTAATPAANGAALDVPDPDV